jgi:hypothetical protein
MLDGLKCYDMRAVEIEEPESIKNAESHIVLGTAVTLEKI